MLYPQLGINVAYSSCVLYLSLSLIRMSSDHLIIYSKWHLLLLLLLLLWSLLVASKAKKRILVLPYYCGRRDLMSPIILEWLMFILSVNLVSTDRFWFWDSLFPPSCRHRCLHGYGTAAGICSPHTTLTLPWTCARRPLLVRKHSQRSQVDINSWFTFVIMPFCLSDVCLVWWRTVHRASKTAGIPLWVWRSYSGSDPESSREKKRVR